MSYNRYVTYMVYITYTRAKLTLTTGFLKVRCYTFPCVGSQFLGSGSSACLEVGNNLGSIKF